MKRSNNATALVALLIAVNLLLASCGGWQAQRAKVEPRPQRIVSLSPSVTEILYGIGAWPQVIAVSQFCTYPEDVKNKPRVNGWDKTNLEQVMALKPDFVIGVDAQEPFLRDKLTGLGVRSLFVKSQTLADIMASMGEIARGTGHEQEATNLVTKTQAEIEAVRKAVGDRPHPRVLCIVDRVPGTIRDLYTATKGSYLDELISIAGGDSIAPQGDRGYGKINKEAVLTLNPEVIIDMVQGSKGNFGEDPIAVWNELAEVRAVREQRIFPMTDPSVIHPSQFVGHTAQVFARALHPESFTDAK
ncbi:MAG TPA: helical backbone metal receptor [Pyrinomonadaceae bacterium]|jgi:iron complex transport system substrate-binding protein|nr:helical backbone metal receptor [Pyrinomonadaceae bacterium]